MKKKKNACGVRTGANKNNKTNTKDVEISIECLLEGGGGGRSNGERNEPKKKTSYYLLHASCLESLRS